MDDAEIKLIEGMKGKTIRDVRCYDEGRGGIELVFDDCKFVIYYDLLADMTLIVKDNST